MNFTIGCVNGCFDVLHVGHVRFLKAARSKCDYLIVLLNSDSSIKQIKGKDRPINCEQDREEMLKALRSVDSVKIFYETTPLSQINELRPDIYFKSKVEDKRAVAEEKKLVESYGGKFVILPTTNGKSTTELLQRLVRE